MSNPSFAVRRFKNRNGISTWRVDGRINGVRIRRNFAIQEEAAAEKATLQIKSEQIAAGMQSVVTCLKGEQVRESATQVRRPRASIVRPSAIQTSKRQITCVAMASASFSGFIGSSKNFSNSVFIVCFLSCARLPQLQNLK